MCALMTREQLVERQREAKRKAAALIHSMDIMEFFMELYQEPGSINDKQDAKEKYLEWKKKRNTFAKDLVKELRKLNIEVNKDHART